MFTLKQFLNILFAYLFLLVSCDAVKFPEDATAAKSFTGCVAAAVADDYKSVTVNFTFPKDASKVQILRDAQLVYETETPTVGSFVDEKVSKGKTYKYNCNAIFDEELVLGKNEISIKVTDSKELLGDKFLGCLDGTSVAADSIQITFEWPELASGMTVRRDGLVINSPTVRTGTTGSFTDNGLAEGETYVYSCSATVNGDEVEGPRTITRKTISTNPPNFAGIKTLVASGSTGAVVGWNIPPQGSVKAATYQVFRSTGLTLDWGATPIKTVSGSSLSTTVTGLGDELTYTFGVRACSAEPVCDTNTVTLQLTTPNTGAPQTSGATSVVLTNGNAIITAPWEHTYGAIAKRYVYKKTGAATVNIADYTLSKTEVIADKYNPTTSLSMAGLSENSTFSFIVRDEDPSGNVNSSTNTVTVVTGDLTAPSYSGIASLTLGAGATAENTLVVGYTGMVQEAVSPATGASHYLMYRLTGAGDACASGTLIATVSNTANPGDNLTYSASGLSPRTTYSFCVKAQDSTGNISATTTYLSKATLDTTAPVFDGIQTLTYDAGTSQFTATWNASSSSDILTYKMSIWKNSASSGGATVLSKAAASFPTSATFTTSDFAFSDLDTVYVKVDACDTAGALTGGTTNCTAFADNLAKSYTLPDITPPAGFAGISSSANLTTPAQGQVTVVWQTPASWTGYRGFKVYTVDTSDNSITFAKDCACSGNNCPDQITSCTVTGLNAYTTYYFHVRAYDEIGNITTYVDPATSRSSKRTTDTTAPTFTSALQVSNSGATISISYSAATDNQSAEGSLTYKIYRKTSSTFASATNPSADGTLLATKATLTHSDTGSEGVTYYYAVCAFDSSNNSTCDGNIKSLTVADSTVPTVSGFTSNKANASTHEWTLSWTMSDNITATGNLRAYIYQSETASASTATASDPETVNASGNSAGVGSTSLTNVRGPTNVDKYVNYLLKVVDEAGNYSTATLTLYSQNAVSITAIYPNSGATAGSTWVLIDGTGINDNATITIGGNNCTSLTVIRSGYKVACKTPAGVSAQDVVVTNSNSSSTSTLTGGYTYSDSTYCASRTAVSPFANSSDGTPPDGSSSKPYKICTFAQLDAIRTYTATSAGKYFELATNIDAQGETFTPLVFGTAAGTDGNIDGKNYMVINITHSGNAYNTGFVKQLSAGSIKNLTIANASFTDPSTAYVQYWGLLIGYMSGGSIDNIATHGTMTIAALSSYGFGGVIGITNNSAITVSNTYAKVTMSGVSSSSPFAGIIGVASAMASITNCGSAGSATAGSYVAGIIGIAYAAVAVSNCSSSMTFPSSGSGSAGIIGLASNDAITITGSSFTGSLSASGYVSGLGGIVGTSSKNISISTSYYAGSLTSAGPGLGGIIGSISGNSSASITNSYAGGSITSNVNPAQVGGLVGFTASLSTGSTLTISSSYATTTISCTFSHCGGLIGSLELATGGLVTATSVTNISNSYYSGAITCQSACGGLVGSFATTDYTHTLNISSSYSKGSISASSLQVGGILGLAGGGASNNSASTTLNIDDTYSLMNLTTSVAAPYTMGGLVGLVKNTPGSATVSYNIQRSFYAGTMSVASGTRYAIVDSTGAGSVSTTCTDVYYDSSVAGGTVASGCGSGTSYSKTTAQMQSSSTFATFDFASGSGKWKMPATTGYPILIWEP